MTVVRSRIKPLIGLVIWPLFFVCIDKETLRYQKKQQIRENKEPFGHPQNLWPSSNTIEVCPRFLQKSANKLLLCEGISPRPLVYSVTKSAGKWKLPQKEVFHRFFSPLHSHQKALPFGNPRRAMLPFRNHPPTRLCLFGLSARRPAFWTSTILSALLW